MSQGGERSPKQTAKDGDANQHEKLIERQLFKESKWRYRPSPACRSFRFDWPVDLVSSRSLSPSRK
jgi:hypothetical protein